MNVPKTTAQQSQQEKKKREAGLFLTFSGLNTQIQTKKQLIIYANKLLYPYLISFYLSKYIFIVLDRFKFSMFGLFGVLSGTS